MSRVEYMSLALLSKREKLHKLIMITQNLEGEVIKRRSYLKKEKLHIRDHKEDTVERSKEIKREKSEDNSEGVVVLLKMKLIEGEYKFYFWHCLTILT